MSTLDDDWTAWISGALCAACRWLSAASLMLVLVALFALATRAQSRPAAAAALALVVALGAVQVYLAVRIEFDRAIFARAAQRPGGFAGFDEALQELGWRRRPVAERTPADRAAGLRTLVAWAAGLLAAQLALELAALWLLT